jgi:hypothetical protein
MRHRTDNSTQVPTQSKKRCESRGMPPPASFDFDTLPDSTRLSTRDIAALERKAVATVESWRLISGHALEFEVENGHVYYTAGGLRRYRAASAKGTTRRPGRPRKPVPSTNQEITP